MYLFFFFKQKTAYEMRISDWSSDVCSSDLRLGTEQYRTRPAPALRDNAGVRALHRRSLRERSLRHRRLHPGGRRRGRRSLLRGGGAALLLAARSSIVALRQETVKNHEALKRPAPGIDTTSTPRLHHAALPPNVPPPGLSVRIG